MGEGLDAPVQIVEEAQKVESELEEHLVLLVPHRAEDLGCIIHVVALQQPG